MYDVRYTGGKLDFGLDDGTGRIRASMWETENQDVEQELAEYGSQNFSYVRAIGKIAEYRQIFSIQLTKIDFVEDPHEIYHHHLRVMVDHLLLQRGPPSQTVVTSTLQPSVNDRPPEVLSMRSLQTNLPGVSHPNGLHQISGASLQRTPSPEPNIPKTPVRISNAISHTQRSPVFSSLESSPVMEVDDTPSRKNYRIGGDFSSAGPSHERPSPSPAPLRLEQPPHRPSLARNSNRPSTTSIAIINQYHASPQFVPPTNLSPPAARPYNAGPRPYLPELGESSPSEPPQAMIIRERMVTQRRDPYSDLTNLQRDIILTIQNVQNSSGAENSWEGVSISMLVQAIATRRPGLKEDEFGNALDLLIDEGYIYSTIDDNHFACT
ncbi:hypothetical protein P691DRAFT_692181 [Macrolepiota fuliginosa MF-IS2]|uniref:Replication protein A C-terminal domain-containing protein n=1 Tax=Macrolepiota fuliginosa MF-IS2 TaxID=1400762 RepID=A0A9P6CAZ3_9AGAR|nr:hypothetical protein P691DRAFT_692181 [Macrolepiota fuliginosa MF-IS2]